MREDTVYSTPIVCVVMALSAFDGQPVDPTPCASYQEAQTIASHMREKKVKGRKCFSRVWVEPYTNQL